MLELLLLFLLNTSLPQGGVADAVAAQPIEARAVGDTAQGAIVAGSGFATITPDLKLWSAPERDDAEETLNFICDKPACAETFALDLSKIEYSADGKALTREQWLKAMTKIGPATKPYQSGKGLVTYAKPTTIVKANGQAAVLIQARVEMPGGVIWNTFSLSFPRKNHYVRVAITGSSKAREKSQALLMETIKSVKIPE